MRVWVVQDHDKWPKDLGQVKVYETEQAAMVDIQKARPTMRTYLDREVLTVQVCSHCNGSGKTVDA